MTGKSHRKHEVTETPRNVSDDQFVLPHIFPRALQKLLAQLPGLLSDLLRLHVLLLCRWQGGHPTAVGPLSSNNLELRNLPDIFLWALLTFLYMPGTHKYNCSDVT